MVLMALAVAALTLQPPVPQPFPQPSGTPQAPSSQPGGQPAAPPRPPTPPAPAQPGRSPQPAAAGEPTAETLGVPIYPGAQFIASYDAGRGQRYYLFGTTASYTDLVSYYRTVLKEKGDEVFDVPATYEFDIGKYREDTMAFPPSVTIKDYQTQVSQGYPNPKPGGQPARFPSVIQIVPVPPGQ
jgi:hypothetical protein